MQRMNRLVGLETEYGCLADDPVGASAVVRRVRDWIFAEGGLGVVDPHQRDWDEPPGNGGFLFNGGRGYIDMGHLELCTAECRSLRDLMLREQANDSILVEALTRLGLEGNCGFIRNNIDHYSGATFGCHENYLIRRAAPLHEVNVLSLLAFLTLRVLYTGAGRLGASAQVDPRVGVDLKVEPVDFQISQRADYIQNDLFEWVQFNRAIINTRDEPLADSRRFRRLHLLHGDTSVLPWTLGLKVGTTALVLDLLEVDRLPRVALDDAVGTLRTLSRMPEGPWRVRVEGGREVDAVDVLGAYLDAARREFGNRDAETTLVLGEWSLALESLAGDTSGLIGKCDWITKRWLFNQFVEQEHLDWSSPWLKSQDLEFHHTDPVRCLATSLAVTPSEWVFGPDAIEHGKHHPPADTRAAVRSMVMRELSRRGRKAFIDWEVVDTEGVNPLTLLDPFVFDESEARAWLKGVSPRG
jgi:hypothetical protein